MHIFKDRTDAGEKLSFLVKKEIENISNIIICAIPNGGVPVAISLAQNLGIKKVFVYLARKIQFPWTTESGFGAVTLDGDTIYNQRYMNTGQLDPWVIKTQTQKALEELQHREKLFKNHILPNNVDNKDIILIDDGLASGITMRASIDSIWKKKPNRIIIAVPTAHSQTIVSFQEWKKEYQNLNLQIICPDIRSAYFFAVADAYKNWKDENSADVLEILNHFNA